MTTEQALREALAGLGGMVAALLAAESGGTALCADMTRALTSAESEARRALAMPQPETLKEWRVRWKGNHGLGWNDGVSGEFSSLRDAEGYAGLLRSSANRTVNIESRTVSTSPWMPAAPPAFDPAEPKGAKSIP